MRIIATALVALGILALPVTNADAHRRYYHHHRHYGPSVMISPGFGFYVGPSYGYHRYYYRDRYWRGGDYWAYRHGYYRPYWHDRYYDPWY
ncbi:hypothetical protein [Rhizobium leucaenae]|nr:hypothetical protein [Rhizobium leucaenae]MBB6303175.1 hypothetical protein [Rhizobium leucaenae]